jgi:hypothetical protein
MGFMPYALILEKMAHTIPPYLQTGDAIGNVCPAGYMAAERIVPCVNTLKSW